MGSPSVCIKTRQKAHTRKAHKSLFIADTRFERAQDFLSNQCSLIAQSNTLI